MFSLKLSYLPSSDERVQSGDERSSAHPCGLTPATVTFQGRTESMLADEDKPPHVPASQQFTTNDSLWQHTHTHTPVGVTATACVTTVIVFTKKQDKLLILIQSILYVKHEFKFSL